MKTTEIILSVIAIILLITTAGFAYMYYSEVGIASNNANTAQQYKSQVSSLQSQLQGTMPAIALSTAMSHWNNIAIENPSSITAQYSPNAQLKWVGGPLTGTYTGTQQISSVWTKFSNLYETVYWYAVTPPVVSAINQGNYSVTAPVQFVVAPSADPQNVFVLNVTETLTISTSSGMNGQIISEIWKVMPIPLTDVIAGYPGQNVLIQNSVLSMAYSHWNNIAIENVSLIMGEYAPTSTLTWAGGPLTGNYTGTQQISSVWTKFSNLYEYVVWYAEMPPTVTVSGTHASVFGQLQFIVFPFNTTANPTPKAVVLNVNETLTYTFNTSTGTWYLSHELWQVKPAPISSVAPGYISEYQ